MPTHFRARPYPAHHRDPDPATPAARQPPRRPAPVMPRLHLRPNPHLRIRFRTLSASIIAPHLSPSHPFSIAPQSTRRVSSSAPHTHPEAQPRLLPLHSRSTYIQ
ncbi:hypothetical protein BGY98DRAFT_1035956 [Russula aff. rugulosa BPL654]|nr:hypothetical protein BGY98DRAFT_1035956 [Russula aff. rugulosa BPL654]